MLSVMLHDNFLWCFCYSIGCFAASFPFFMLKCFLGAVLKEKTTVRVAIGHLN